MMTASPGVATLRAAVARSTLAPSTRNAQPWRWRIHPDHVELSLDPGVARRLSANDPRHRELVISCGAALLTLRVAAAERLVDLHVDPFPDPHRPDLVAQVTAERGVIDAAFAELDAAVPLRHTVHGSFADRPLPEGLVARLEAEAAAEGARWSAFDGAPRDRLSALVTAADREWFEDVDRREEAADWITSRWSDEGRPVATLAVLPTRAALRHLDLGSRLAERDLRLLAGAPHVAVVTTAGDGPRDWLVAGQALQRALLVAAGEGVAAGFLNTVCQLDDVRADLRDHLTGGAHPQVLVRLGVPADPLFSTPRRPVREVVSVAARGE